MKRILLMIMLLFLVFSSVAIYAEVTDNNDAVQVAGIEYVENSDPYDFSDEELVDEETAKLDKQKEAYDKKNAIEKAVYNKRYIIYIIVIIVVIVVIFTIVFVKLNRKRWK